MFSKAVSASLARKGKFGILWLAATVGSHERSLSKTELIKINLTEACEQIVAAEPGGAPPTPSPSASSSEMSDEDEDDATRRKRKARTKKKKKTKRRREEDDGEKVVIGLRLSANLMLGVCRVYDLQVTVTSSDATQLFLGLRPMLNEYNRGGKAGVAGGPRRLDMADDFARPNNSNLDAPEEPDLMFGYAHGFGNPEWDILEPVLVSSLGKSTTMSGSTRTGEDDMEEDDVTGQARARQRSIIGSPSRINLHEPHLFGSDYLGSQPPEVPVEFDPGVDEGLGLLDDNMMMDDPAVSGVGGRPSSSAFPVGTGMGGDDFQYPQDDAFNFDMGDVQPMDVDQQGQPRVPSSEDVTESSLSSILKAPGAGPKRKKTVKLAKMDAELTYPDSEIKDWRKTYVKKMIDQGNAAKEKHAEKDARDAAVAILQQVPAVIGIQAPDMVDFLLGQQNKKKNYLTTPKARARRPKKRVGSPELEEDIEDDDQRPGDQYQYPMDNDNFDMNDVQPMDDGPGYVDYSMSIKGGNDTTMIDGAGDDEGVEMGRGGSSRKSSSAPWDSVLHRGPRQSSVGFGGDANRFGPGSSSVGRASTAGRMSLAADTLRRHQRSGSHISSGGRSGSVDRFARPSQRGGTDDDLDAAYPGADMLQDPGYIQDDDEIVSTFSLERQSYTFLEYLKRMVSDLPRPTPILNSQGEDVAEPLRTITFSTLAPIESCTPSAAAKGFYQILVLCTKDVVALSQEDEFGEIEVRLK